MMECRPYFLHKTHTSPMAKQTQLVTITGKGDAVLSKAQKQFNNYLKKLDKLKIEIEQTKDILEYLTKAIHENLIPAEALLIDKRVEWVLFLDTQYDEQKKLTAKDKEILAELITDHAFQLIDKMGKDDLKPVFEKYKGKSFDTIQEEANQATSEMMKEFFSNMMGIEFDEDVDVSDPQKMQEYLQEKVLEKQQAFEDERKNRKKSKKQIEKEEKAAAEAQLINKSVREIYTKLVKEFHPDRELDEIEKQRKTEVMKCITAAYEKNDLMELLRLQLEYEHISQNNINQLAEDQLKRYNKVLKEQIDALDEELFYLQGGGDPASPYTRLGEPTSKAEADWKIKYAKQEIDQLIKTFEQDFIDMLDIKELKQSLKAYRKSKKEKERMSL
jgi:hypothetical protein